jgi:hypothetical protein
LSWLIVVKTFRIKAGADARLLLWCSRFVALHFKLLSYLKIDFDVSKIALVGGFNQSL